MNPPSTLHGAMSQNRKPFTYTPGGLDLSEIKSERMAKRLMRNAMNQGVPEVPSQHLQSPPTPSTPMVVPNFNCLPVQVFPAMPANPRSLLRTRSCREPQKKAPRINQIPLPNDFNQNALPKLQQNTPLQTSLYQPSNDTYLYRRGSMHELNQPNTELSNVIDQNYETGEYPVLLPEVSYDAQYFNTKLNTTNGISQNYYNLDNNKLNYTNKYEDIESSNMPSGLISNNIENSTKNENEVFGDNQDDQRDVRVVKKKEKKSEVESSTEVQNGNHNGNSDLEEVVKAPVKKSAAKSETKVEIVKKILPDGSIEETKTTTTKTTVDGKTKITTQTETTVIPKDDDEEEIEEDEEEIEEVEEVEEVEEGEDVQEEVIEKIVKDTKDILEEPTTFVVKTPSSESNKVKENGHEAKLLLSEEKSAIITTNKVSVSQSDDCSEIVQNREQIDTEVVSVENEEESLLKTSSTDKYNSEENEVIVETEQEETVSISLTSNKTEEVTEKEQSIQDKTLGDEVKEQSEETKLIETKTEETDKNISLDTKEVITRHETVESEYTEEEYESEVEEKPSTANEPTIDTSEQSTNNVVKKPSETDIPVQIISTKSEENPEKEKEESQHEDKSESTESKVPLREPSVPLEKVEDVEIKPIAVSNNAAHESKTQTTEISMNTNNNISGCLTTQSEYNRIENIVTVNRTTKTLDRSYEQLTQQGSPTMKTYFAPNRERVSISPSKAYQPTFTPEPPTERRHSLLLERLSMERQLPSLDLYQNSYQYSNQTNEQQRQSSQEPQSEVLTVSNVKPSKITNQEWYQKSKKENVLYNNVAPNTLNVPSEQWNQSQSQNQNLEQKIPYQYQPAQHSPQPQYSPQPQHSPQPQYSPQPHYSPLPQYSPQPTFSSQPLSSQTQYYPSQYRPPYHPQRAQSQPRYTETNINSVSQDYTQSSSILNQKIDYTPYIPSTPPVDNLLYSLPNSSLQTNQFTSNNKSSDSYQSATQQYSSGYVPPPWELDSTYAGQSLHQSAYQTVIDNSVPAPPPAHTFSPTTKSGGLAPASSKFVKPAPTSFIPPAPNQSFVKPLTTVEHHDLPGRKTYYSEYERRYITVPESTYIPSETKLQQQPDPSPQYYYDNNETTEAVEHKWRKELREFTEKSQTVQTEQKSVKPPWEQDAIYSKIPSVKYNPTPSWSQTLGPQSYRERSFEAESLGSQEWMKTNTLGRGRPLSTYGSSDKNAMPQRTRGVSVDRYNPIQYRSPIPSEHPPVQSQTLTPETAPHSKGHQNPHVPAYHARASAEPRDPSAQVQWSRPNRENRASPLQSRSFKYLQWITGTDE